MKAYAKILGVVLVAVCHGSVSRVSLVAYTADTAVAREPAAGGKGPCKDPCTELCKVLVSRAFTVMSNPINIFVSRAFTVTDKSIVSRAFTATSNTDNIFVSRAFTVTSNPVKIFVSRAFTVVNCAGGDGDSGLCADCNGNNAPDACDLDCNAEDLKCDPETCGQSDDCNDNGVPDECELPDSCPEGICPEGCDADCNDNCMIDACDIADCSPGDPDCDDCNGNGIPDECDIDSNNSSDVVGPGQLPDNIPDECQLDCNENFIPDDLDISDGTSPDCNGNGIPDECEIDVDSPAPGGPFFCTETCDPDCDDNGIPDECDIANCPPATPFCGDCNVNGIPDGCDIISGDSQDVDPADGVPDECVEWNGNAKNDDFWNTPENWETDEVPGDDNPNDLESVVIAGKDANVILDINADIDSLSLGSGAMLHVTDGSLSVADPLGGLDGNILVRGDLLIGDGRLIDAEGEVTIGPGGIYQAEDPNDLLLDAILDAGSITVQGGGVVNVSGSMELISAGEVTIGPGGVYQADPEAGGPITATLAAGSITVQGGGIVNMSGLMAFISEGEVTIGPGGVYQADPEAGGPITATLAAGSITVRGGTIDLTGSMELSTSGDLGLQSSDDGKGGCKGSGTPPDFNSADDAQVRVMGNFTISECAEVSISSSEPVIIEGDMQNESTLPGDFDWDTGELEMNGPDETSQTIEAAGEDRGPCPAGFNGNFVIGTLTLAENTVVLVVDEFDNQEDGTTACDEALYVGVLILEAGSELQTNGCRVYYEELINNDGSIPGMGTDVLEVKSTCADFDDNGAVDAFDLATLLGSWGPCPPEDVCPADLNGDGDVGAFDLALLLGSWGPVP